MAYSYHEVNRRYREWHHPPLDDACQRMASCQEDYREELGIPYRRYGYSKLRDTRYMRTRGRDYVYRRLNCPCLRGHERAPRAVVIRDNWGAGDMCVVCGRTYDKWANGGRAGDGDSGL